MHTDPSPSGRPALRLAPTEHPRIWTAARGLGQVMRITVAARDAIRRSVGRCPAETGGMLGGSRLDGVVRCFEFDESAAATTATYSPSHELLSSLLRERWNPRGDQLLGFVHSHPSGYRRPSGPDIEYAHRFLACNPDLDEMLLPILTSAADHGGYGCSAFAVRRGAHSAVPLGLALTSEPRIPSADSHPAFERVVEAYDLGRMSRSRLVVVGAGGASQYVEDMCRAGIGEVILVDPDEVEPRNTATQQVYLGDIGTAKVEALAARLVTVSPTVLVVAVHAGTDDLTDGDLTRLATARLAGRPRPEVSVMCGFTDDFWAQARVARLALHLGLPALAAQVYTQGRAAEVTFALPGRTPACQRCALGSRYRAYLERDFRNDVGSGGTPIFSTSRLNALKGQVTLALLHGAGAEPAAGPGARRWLNLLDRIGNRNLIMVRLDPDLARSVGIATFDRVFAGADRDRLVTDETVWLPQEPENPSTGFPPCGDCGGTGDLRDAIGTLDDTRLLPAQVS